MNAHKKRRVVLGRASGYRGQRSRLYRKGQRNSCCTPLTTTSVTAKARKGDFRKLWIQRINAAVRAEGASPTTASSRACVSPASRLDRRALAEIAVSDPDTFKTIVDAARPPCLEDVNAPVEA